MTVEYGRGVTENNGVTVVKRDLEITEAKTFMTSAANAFGDLEPLLVKLDKNAVLRAKQDFAKLETDLNNAAKHQNVISFANLQQ